MPRSDSSNRLDSVLMKRRENTRAPALFDKKDVGISAKGEDKRGGMGLTGFVPLTRWRGRAIDLSPNPPSLVASAGPP